MTTQVQCIFPGPWYDDFGNLTQRPEPQFLNIYTPTGEHLHFNGRPCIYLAEFPRPRVFDKAAFRPIEPLPPETVKIEERVS